MLSFYMEERKKTPPFYMEEREKTLWFCTDDGGKRSCSTCMRERIRSLFQAEATTKEFPLPVGEG